MTIIKQQALVCLLALFPLPSLVAKEKHHKHKTEILDDKEPWACVKNHKIVKVKGKSNRQKQDHCEAQMGIWEKERTALQETHSKSQK